VAHAVRQAHALWRAEPGAAACPVRGLRLARRRADGYPPARRAGPDRRSRLQRPRRGRLRARAGMVAGPGRSVAATRRMNPDGANDVIDYLDALLDDSQPVAADAAASARAAPALDPEPAFEPAIASAPTPVLAPAPAAVPAFAPQDM